ncbi:hemicentin-2-like [Haliotis cracherodii]|uniref:hemicentin-2-like n=1 Tax=Haliotis cracherodii TaxID=6455 RepID=UPI0039EA3D82
MPRLSENERLRAIASQNNTVARVGERVHMSWNVLPAVPEFEIVSVRPNGKLRPHHSKILFDVKDYTHVFTTINTHTEDGTRIQLSVNTSLQGRTVVSLLFHSVDVQDAGVYQCVTYDSDWSANTWSQLLIVLQKPSQPSISTTSADPVSGGPVTLTCSSTSRNLPLDRSLYPYTLNTSYTWRRNNRRVESGVHVEGPVLTIDNVTKGDKGVYTCQSEEEGVLSDWSQGYTLTVLYGPDTLQFNGNIDNVSVVEGDPLTVRCSADCNPACTVTWLDTSRLRVITGQKEAVLYIPAVDRSVSGQYTCNVNNTHGMSSRSLKLAIQPLAVTGAGFVSIVPVTAACSVLIVTIAVVVICVVRRKQTREERGYLHNRVVAYTRDEETGGSYQEIEEGGSIQNRVVSYARDEDNDGSYQEIEEAVNVDDIAPLVAVYSVMLTAVAVVVAAVAILVCKDVKDGHSRRFGEYLTVVGEGLSCDISDAPCAATNDEDALSLHDYERLLREQFHIYTCLNPSASSTDVHCTRCNQM